ncbi:Twitching mobility protein [compost metagenome]
MQLTSDEECTQNGTMSAEIIDFLRFIIPSGANVSLSGQHGSGITTTLSQFPKYMEKSTRILFIDDNEEVLSKSKRKFADYPNFHSFYSLLEAKGMKYQKEKSYSIDCRMKAAIFSNQDVIVIGEIQDEADAKQALIGMNTGHIVWNTINANSAAEAARRFLLLNGNTLAAANQVGVSLDFIMFHKKLKSGVRVITEISELLGYQGAEKPILNPIFKYDYQSNTHQRVGSIKSGTMLEKIYFKEPVSSLIDHWCTST